MSKYSTGGKISLNDKDELNTLIRFDNVLTELEKKRNVKFKYDLDLNVADQKRAEDLLQLFDEKSRNGMNDYFQAQKKAINELSESYEKLEEIRSSNEAGELTGEEYQRKYDRQANTIVRQANAYIALGYDIDEAKQKIFDFAKAQEKVLMKNSNGSYQYTVENFKELFDIMKELMPLLEDSTGLSRKITPFKIDESHIQDIISKAKEAEEYLASVYEKYGEGELREGTRNEVIKKVGYLKGYYRLRATMNGGSYPTSEAYQNARLHLDIPRQVEEEENFILGKDILKGEFERIRSRVVEEVQREVNLAQESLVSTYRDSLEKPKEIIEMMTSEAGQMQKKVDYLEKAANEKLAREWGNFEGSRPKFSEDRNVQGAYFDRESFTEASALWDSLFDQIEQGALTSDEAISKMAEHLLQAVGKGFATPFLTDDVAELLDQIEKLKQKIVELQEELQKLQDENKDLKDNQYRGYGGGYSSYSGSSASSDVETPDFSKCCESLNDIKDSLDNLDLSNINTTLDTISEAVTSIEQMFSSNDGKIEIKGGTTINLDEEDDPLAKKMYEELKDAYDLMLGKTKTTIKYKDTSGDVIKYKGLAQISWDEISAAIISNIPSVGARYNYNISDFQDIYSFKNIQSKPIKERIALLQELFGWVKQLKKADLGDAYNSAIKRIVNHLPETQQVETQSRLPIASTIDQILSTLKQILKKITEFASAVGGEVINDIPNLNDPFLSDRGLVLKNLYNKIGTKKNGEISTSGKNEENIKDFLKQFNIYGNGEWTLDEFARVNNISKKDLSILKKYNDELLARGEIVRKNTEEQKKNNKSIADNIKQLKQSGEIREVEEHKQTEEHRQITQGLENEIPASPKSDSDLTSLKDKNKAFEEERETVDSVIEAEKSKIKELEGAVDDVTKAVERKTRAFEEEGIKVGTSVASEEKLTEETGTKKKRTRSKKKVAEEQVPTPVQDKTLMDEKKRLKAVMMLERTTENLLHNENLNGEAKENLAALLEMLKEMETMSGMTKDEWADIQIIVTDITNKAKSNILLNKELKKQNKEQEKANKQASKENKDSNKKDQTAPSSNNLSENVKKTSESLDKIRQDIVDNLVKMQKDIESINLILKDSFGETSVSTELTHNIIDAVRGESIMGNTPVVKHDDDRDIDKVEIDLLLSGEKGIKATLSKEKGWIANTLTGEASPISVLGTQMQVPREVWAKLFEQYGYINPNLAAHHHASKYIAPSGEEGDLSFFKSMMGNGVDKQLITAEKQIALFDMSVINNFMDFFDAFSDIYDKYQPSFDDYKDAGLFKTSKLKEYSTDKNPAYESWKASVVEAFLEESRKLYYGAFDKDFKNELRDRLKDTIEYGFSDVDFSDENQRNRFFSKMVAAAIPEANGTQKGELLKSMVSKYSESMFNFMDFYSPLFEEGVKFEETDLAYQKAMKKIWDILRVKYKQDTGIEVPEFEQWAKIIDVEDARSLKNNEVMKLLGMSDKTDGTLKTQVENINRNVASIASNIELFLKGAGQTSVNTNDNSNNFTTRASNRNTNQFDKILDEYSQSNYKYLDRFLKNRGYNVDFNDISMRAFERGITTTPAPLSRQGWFKDWDFQNRKQTTDFNAMRNEDFEKWKKSNKQGKMSDVEYKKKFLEDYLNLIIRARREAEKEDKPVWDDYYNKINDEYKETVNLIKNEDKNKAEKEKLAKNTSEKYLKGLLDIYEKKDSRDEYIYTDSARQEADRLRGALQTEIQNKGLSILEDPNNIKNQVVNDVIEFLEKSDKLSVKRESPESLDDLIYKTTALSRKDGVTQGTLDQVNDLLLSLQTERKQNETTKKFLDDSNKKYDELNRLVKEDISRAESLKKFEDLLKDLDNVINKVDSNGKFVYSDATRNDAAKSYNWLKGAISNPNVNLSKLSEEAEYKTAQTLAKSKEKNALEEILNKAKTLAGKDNLLGPMKTEVNDFVKKVENILDTTALTKDLLDEIKNDYTDLNRRASEDIKIQKEKNDLATKLNKIMNRKNNEGEFFFTKDFRNEASRMLKDLKSGSVSTSKVKEFTSGQKDPDKIVASRQDINSYIVRGEKLVTQDYMKSSTKKKFESLIKQLRLVGEEGGHSKVEINKLIQEFQSLEIEAAKTGKTLLGQVGQRLQDMNAKFIATYLSFHDIVRYGRAVISTVTELDTALTEMRKVSDESVKSLREYQKATFGTASALGTTAVQLQQSTAEWMRLGETMEEASKSAVAATTLFNVSEFENINDATSALVAMSQAYKDLDKTEIIDVMNNIGNNYSIATDELATALQASAAALMTQGNDLYQAAALVTAGNAIIQDADKVGTGIRTISLRIAGIKEGEDDSVKEQLEELGEEVDDWVVQTEAKKRKVIMDYTKVAANGGQGVDILDSNGNLKSTYDILLEIAKVYKDIQEEDKKNGTNRAQGLVEELAGKNRSNIAASILQNPELLESVYESAKDSAGSAAEENAKYLDSIIGKTQQFKNELQELEANVLDSEVIKDVVDLGTFILKTINKLDKALPPLIALIGSIGLGIKNAHSEWIKFAQINDAGTGKGFLGDNTLSKMASKLLGIGDIKNYGIKFGSALREELSDYFDLSYIVDTFKSDVVKPGVNVEQLTADFVDTISGTSGKVAQSLRDSDAFQDVRDAIIQGIDPSSAVNNFINNSDELKEALSEDAQALIDEGLGSLTELTTAQEEVTVATEAATGAVTAFNGVIGTLGAFGLSAAVTLVTMGIKKLITYSAELEEKARVASETIKTVKEELKDNDKYIKDVQREFVTLSRGVDDLGNNITLSNDQFDRYNDIANEIAERFPTMVDGWTAEGNAIIGVANSVQELDEAYKKYRQDQLAEAADKKNIDAAAEDLVNFTKRNYWEQLGSTFTSFWINNEHVKKTGYGIDYRTQEAFLDDIAQMSIEEFNKKINEDKKYRLAISRYFSDSTFEAMTGGISGDEIFEWTGKEEGDKYKGIASVSPQMFAVLQKQARSELSQVNQKLNEKLKSFQEALEVTFEFNLSYSDTFLDAQTQVIAEQIIDNLDANFLTQLAQDTTMANAFTDTLIEALGNVDNQALASLYTVKSDDVNYKKAEEELLAAWKKVYDDVMAQMADATPEEKLQLSNILNTIWESSGMAEYTIRDDAFQASLDKIAGGDEQARKYLEEVTKDFSINNMQLWLDTVQETDNATEAVERYTKALKKADDTLRASDVKHLFSQDTIVDRNKFDSEYNTLLSEYEKELKRAKLAGADFNRTTYGNINLDNRGVLEWNTENIEKYKDAIESWGGTIEEYKNTISTVDGMSEEFDGIEIAFSPMLQTPDGPVYLDKDTLHEYINTLIGKMPEGYTSEDLLKLDSKGLIINGQKISGMIAEIGDNAIKVGETMHYLGEDGSLNTLQKKIDGLEESFYTWADVRKDLIGLAQSGKLDEDTFKNYKYFEKILKALGVSAENTDEALKVIIDDINEIAGNNEVDKFANAKADLDKLNNAYQAFKEGKPIDATTLNEVQDTFAYLGVSYRDFEQAVMTGEEDLQSYFDELISQYIIQEGLLDNLNESNKEWVEQQLEGYGLTKKSAEEMTSKAIENNNELQRNLLNTTQKLNNIVTLSTETQNKIANATNIDELDTKEISDLVTAILASDSGATEDEKMAAQDLALYALQKALAGDKSLENEEDIEYLSDLIAACNVATEAVKQLARAKKLEASIAISTNAIQDVLNSNMSESEKNKAIYSLQMAIDLDTKELDSIDLSAIGEETYKEVVEAWRKKDPNRGLKGIYGGLSDANSSAAEEAYQKAKELLEKLLALYDAELEAGTITVQEYVEKSRRLIEEYYNSGKIKAADYYGYLESLAEKEKNQYDKVISAVQKLIQNQIKELEKQKEAIEENYNSQIEAIQEKIDAIQDENEEIDKNMALQKAQYNLLRNMVTCYRKRYYIG